MLTQEQINEVIDQILFEDAESYRFTDGPLFNKMLTLVKHYGQDKSQAIRVYSLMEDKKLVIRDPNGSVQFTEFAIGFRESGRGSWKAYTKEQSQDAQLEKEIKYLTRDQLNESLKHMKIQFTQIKYSGWILLATILLSGFFGAFFQAVFTKLSE